MKEEVRRYAEAMRKAPQTLQQQEWSVSRELRACTLLPVPGEAAVGLRLGWAREAAVGLHLGWAQGATRSGQ